MKSDISLKTAFSSAAMLGALFLIAIALPFLAMKRHVLEEELIKAAAEGNTDRVRYLVESGTNINAQFETGETALFAASFNDELKTAKELLLLGADRNIRNDEGKAPTDVAHSDEMRMLLSASPNSGNSPGILGNR